MMTRETMQGIYHKLTSIGLVGLTATSFALVAPNVALALTEQQILEKLDGIPVFLIVNEEGQSLTASVNSQDQERQVPSFSLTPRKPNSLSREPKPSSLSWLGGLKLPFCR
jgi:hypothetical protein